MPRLASDADVHGEIIRGLRRRRSEIDLARIQDAFGSDFNFDFNVSVTEEQQREGAVEYNYERSGPALDAKQEAASEGPFAAIAGTDVAN